MVADNSIAYNENALSEASPDDELLDEYEYDELDSEPQEIRGEFLGVLGLVVGAASTFLCLVLRVAHFPVVGILSIIGLILNIISIVTDRARVLATFGIIMSIAGMGMTVLVILKLLHWL